MRETTTSGLSASISATTDGPRTDAATPTAHIISVKLVKAFVQPDGSHGNGAGVVLLPGILNSETEHNNRNGNRNISSKPENCNDLFPSDGDCLEIAKRVGLPETCFVLFSKNKKSKSCEKHSLSEDEQGQEDNDGGDDDNDDPFPTTVLQQRLRRLSNDEDNKDTTPKDFGDRSGVDGTDGSRATATADFHVKWYTPEREVDMCGHATVALAGYIHSIVTARARAKSDGSGESDSETRQRNSYFWRMQCKAGLLGIEVVDGVCNSIAPAAGVSNSNTAENRKTNKTNNNDGLLRFPRVVMEQANPEFCGIIDCKEIAVSLSLCVENDLAIAVTDGNSEDDNRTNSEKTGFVFPFAHCEIVSTGGRDLMIPVRSTVLNEMDILGNGNSSSSNSRQQLCDNINIVSKRYDIVGYHMFAVDDSLFLNKYDSETYNSGAIEIKPGTKNVRNDESIEGWNTADDCPIHLNELIRIFQMSKEKGRSGAESCLEAVMLEHLVRQRDHQDDAKTNAKNNSEYGDDDNDNDRDTSATTTVPIARQSRIVFVTGIRDFAPFVGIPEEPATGSANGALACYLVKYLFLEACCCTTTRSTSRFKHRSNYASSLDSSPISFRFCMEQGRAMGEPCLIDAEIEVVNGTIKTVKVGGLVHVTGDSLDLDLNSI
jgi:predicted PhzF superfamily epimerase YddE/YHI9